MNSACAGRLAGRPRPSASARLAAALLGGLSGCMRGCMRGCVWRGMLGVLIQTPAFAQAPVAPPVGDADFASLLARPVGAQPAQDMHWPQVLDAIGRRADGTRLRDVLLDLWLREAAGLPLPPARTIDAWLKAAREQAPLVPAEAVEARWARGVALHLQPRPASASVPVPEALDGLRANLAEAAPGLWSYPNKPGMRQQHFAWVEVVNAGPRPFPVLRFSLRAGDAVLDCDLPRNAVPRLLAPQAVTGLLCRFPVGFDPGRVPAAAWLHDTHAAGAWHIEPGPMGDIQQGLVADALALPLKAERDAWLARRQAGIDTRVAQRRAAEQADQAARERGEAMSRRLKFAGMALGATIGYVLAARLIGRWAASVVLWVVGMFICVPLGRSVLQANYADSWGGFIALPMGLLLFALPTVAAVFAALAHAFVGRLWTDEGYRVRVIWSVAGLLGIVVLELLYALLRRNV